MALKGFTRKFKPVEILTEEEVEAIHTGTLEVLWKTGARMEHERALKLLEKNGCKVDYHTTYTPYFGFEGVPPCMAMLESLAARIRNSTKFLVAGHSNDSEVFAIEMAQAVGIEIMGTCTAAPPLTFYRDAVESAFRLAAAGLPVGIVGAPVMGGSAPATIAGGIVSNNVEVIAGLMLTQLIKPGTRVLALDFAMPMDMSTGAPAFGSIGVCLHMAAFNQIFRKYGVPTYDADGYPNSKMPD